MAGFPESFYFCRHTIFQISNRLIIILALCWSWNLLLLFLLGFCEKADKIRSGLFPQDFFFCSSSSGRWADLNLTFLLIQLHCLLQSYSFNAPMHKNGVCFLYLAKSHISVSSEARAVTVGTVSLFLSRARCLSLPDVEGWRRLH